jgi:hypothetical protein
VDELLLKYAGDFGAALVLGYFMYRVTNLIIQEIGHRIDRLIDAVNELSKARRR